MYANYTVIFYQGRQADGEPESKKASLDGENEERHRWVHLLNTNFFKRLDVLRLISCSSTHSFKQRESELKLTSVYFIIQWRIYTHYHNTIL